MGNQALSMDVVHIPEDERPRTLAVRASQRAGRSDAVSAGMHAVDIGMRLCIVDRRVKSVAIKGKGESSVWNPGPWWHRRRWGRFAWADEPGGMCSRALEDVHGSNSEQETRSARGWG